MIRKEDILARISDRTKSENARRHATAILSLVAIACAVFLLRQIGTAMTADKAPLDCVYSATDAHEHNSSCYRDGVLVCPVPEREEHRHEEDCYERNMTLACGLDEGEGHTHDQSCYEVEETLVCGLEETTGPHVHSAACLPSNGRRSEATVYDQDVTDESGRVVASVHAEAPAGALPPNSRMVVSLIDSEQVSDTVTQEILSNSPMDVVASMTAVDISFASASGGRIEPTLPVAITLKEPSVADTSTDSVIVHISDDNEAETIETFDEDEIRERGLPSGEDSLSFESDSFSPFVIASVVRSVRLTASDGHNYTIDIDCPALSGIPANAILSVREIVDGTEEYRSYREASEQAIGRPVAFARVFDISILDQGWNEIQPAEGTPVSVSISIDDVSDGIFMEGDDAHVVHFGPETETVATHATDNVVSFDATSFSVYAIVTPVAYEEVATGNVPDFVTLSDTCDDREFYMSVTRGGVATYLTSRLDDTNNRHSFRSTTDPDAAAVWHFEPVTDGMDRLYRIWVMTDDGMRYIENYSGNYMRLSETGTVFELSMPVNGKFHLKAQGQSKWLQYSNSGSGFRMYTKNDDAGNTQFSLGYVPIDATEPDDPYELDGKTYGVVYQAGTTTATALMSSEQQSAGNVPRRLEGFGMQIRPDVVSMEGYLLVSDASDISEWTFYNISGRDYLLMASVDGEDFYLAGDQGNLYLVPEPSMASPVTITLGRRENSEKYCLSIGDRFLSLIDQRAANGFGLTSSAEAGSWLSLVQKSEVVGDDDFQEYLAWKENVSDTEAIADGKAVVIYTRVWNESTLRYDYYVVSHDGTLIECYETGDSIQWIGSKVNTALWEFTEYHNADGTPNYYYELRNTYSGKYLAPQIRDGQVLSDNTLGVNLNGRRYNDDYTTIVAWDDPYYEYAGIKVEGGRIVSCPIAQAGDFYFALVSKSEEEEEELTTVNTVDNNDYGISMKIIDFNNPKLNDRDSVQNPFFGAHQSGHDMGLLATNLDDTGYPSTTNSTGHEVPLSDLFDNMMEANHLFLQSTYNESGYFEYDSTQNFAHYDETSGDFTVYNQIAAIGTTVGPTRTHGQFMPFNTIHEGDYATDNHGNYITNQTDVLQNPLPDLNPRKGEKLYRIPLNVADYFFGMEMSASFTQTANGVDAWGHDIIFEFTGDDDFWLYVDDELVIDLGGVRPALPGSINFRTGVVKNADTTTTLYQIFRNNYVARGLSEAEIQTKLDSIFRQNANGQYVFKDYTQHTMRMFYMERGAGASNLHMRFNLASVKPGSVTLGKTISGTDKPDYDLAEFPFQIWYTSKADGETQYHLLTERASTEPDATYNVTYSGKSVPVRYSQSYTPPGGTSAYQSVFFLKPGQLADISFPAGSVSSYYIVECGVGENIYDSVSVNGVQLTGTESANGGRMDYPIDPATVDERSRVIYDNHVSPDALRELSITKKLYDADGETIVNDDPTGFNFRLYLAGEGNEMAPANMYPYLVKNGNDEYCVWDVATQSFVSTGKNEYALLTAEEVARATFVTSPNGSISKIPANHTVEVRDLVIGIQFMVLERDSEIPAGYVLREQDGYTRVGGSYLAGESDNMGVIRDNNNPAIEIRNQRGWGLTGVKQWSDASFMHVHGSIYLAVYVDDGDGGLTLVDGTVKRLANGQTSAYWFFPHMPVANFSQCVVREVTIGTESPVVAEDGTVTNPGAVIPLEAGDTLSVVAKVEEEDDDETYSYEVGYAPGTPTGATETLHNVKVDTVTNGRNGIRIVKTDLDGNPLPEARFTLQDDDGNSVGNQSYSSDDTGLVTVAYLPNGTYTLTETQAPATYHALESPLSITISETGCQLGGDSADMCDYVEPSSKSEMATIRIKNKPFVLRFIKANGSGTPLEGAHFELYRQVIDAQGNAMHDYLPMPGYEDLITDSNGVIPSLTQILPVGDYYLHETDAPEGYVAVDEFLHLSIGSGGTATCDESDNWTIVSTSDEYSVTCVITVTNQPIPTVVLEATKRWMTTGGLTESPWPAGATVTLGLYERDPSTHALTPVNRPGTDAHYQITLDNVPDILDEPEAGTARFYGIPEGPRYVVQELECPNGYHVQYGTEGQDYEIFDANGNATVSNVPDTISVSVSKAWYGNEVPTDATATLRVYSYLTDPSTAQPVEGTPDIVLPTQGGNGAPSWVATFDKLRKYDSTGLVENHYIVREVEGTLGYQPSYEVPGRDYAEDAGTITNMPMSQSFSFDKQWAGLAATEQWPEGIPPVSVDITRTLTTTGGATVEDTSFLATYLLSASPDGQQAFFLHSDGTTLPETWDGNDAPVSWDGSTFALADLPVRGSVGDSIGTWSYHVSEATSPNYETTYRLHGSTMEGATRIGNGGTIVNTISAISDFSLPSTGSAGREAIMTIGTAAVIVAILRLGAGWLTKRKEDTM